MFLGRLQHRGHYHRNRNIADGHDLQSHPMSLDNLRLRVCDFHSIHSTFFRDSSCFHCLKNINNIVIPMVKYHLAFPTAVNSWPTNWPYHVPLIPKWIQWIQFVWFLPIMSITISVSSNNTHSITL